MPLFIVTGLLGLLFFLGSLIFGDHDVGHDHDVDGDHEGTGPSLISVFTISWFLIGFGGAGAITRANDVRMAFSTAAGLIAGMLCWGLAFSVMGLLRKQQADSTVTTTRLMSVIATVTMSIPSNGVGKIQCTVSGSTQEFLARSAKNVDMPEGTRVRVTGDAGGVYLVEAT